MERQAARAQASLATERQEHITAKAYTAKVQRASKDGQGREGREDGRKGGSQGSEGRSDD